MEPSELIAMARRRAGLTQAELARRAGTSQPVISAYERGLRDPSHRTLRRLVEAAGGRMRVEMMPTPMSELPPPATIDEHARRLVDVLGLADALPKRRRPPTLDMPRLVSR